MSIACVPSGFVARSCRSRHSLGFLAATIFSKSMLSMRRAFLDVRTIALLGRSSTYGPMATICNVVAGITWQPGNRPDMCVWKKICTK